MKEKMGDLQGSLQGRGGHVGYRAIQLSTLSRASTVAYTEGTLCLSLSSFSLDVLLWLWRSPILHTLSFSTTAARPQQFLLFPWRLPASHTVLLSLELFFARKSYCYMPMTIATLHTHSVTFSLFLQLLLAHNTTAPSISPTIATAPSMAIAHLCFLAAKAHICPPLPCSL